MAVAEKRHGEAASDRRASQTRPPRVRRGCSTTEARHHSNTSLSSVWARRKAWKRLKSTFAEAVRRDLLFGISRKQAKKLQKLEVFYAEVGILLVAHGGKHLDGLAELRVLLLLGVVLGVAFHLLLVASSTAPLEQALLPLQAHDEDIRQVLHCDSVDEILIVVEHLERALEVREALGERDASFGGEEVVNGVEDQAGERRAFEGDEVVERLVGGQAKVFEVRQVVERRLIFVQVAAAGIEGLESRGEVGSELHEKRRVNAGAVPALEILDAGGPLDRRKEGREVDGSELESLQLVQVGHRRPKVDTSSQSDVLEGKKDEVGRVVQDGSDQLGVEHLALALLFLRLGADLELSQALTDILCKSGDDLESGEGGGIMVEGEVEREQSRELGDDPRGERTATSGDRRDSGVTEVIALVSRSFALEDDLANELLSVERDLGEEGLELGVRFVREVEVLLGMSASQLSWKLLCVLRHSPRTAWAASSSGAPC